MTESWVKKVRIFVSVRDIKYLIRGGRLSATKGFIARVLNINPIVSIDESGKAIVFDKSFNQKANMEKVMGYIAKLVQRKKTWNYIVLHANNSDAAKWYSERMEESQIKNRFQKSISHRLSGPMPVSELQQWLYSATDLYI